MILLLRAALILATSGFVRKKADSLFSLSQESEKFFFQVFKVSEHLMWPHTYFSHFFLSNNSSSLSYKDAKSTVPLAPELEKKKNKQKKDYTAVVWMPLLERTCTRRKDEKKNRRRSETASAAREKQVVPRDASSQTQEAI